MRLKRLAPLASIVSASSILYGCGAASTTARHLTVHSQTPDLSLARRAAGYLQAHGLPATQNGSIAISIEKGQTLSSINVSWLNNSSVYSINDYWNAMDGLFMLTHTARFPDVAGTP